MPQYPAGSAPSAWIIENERAREIEIWSLTTSERHRRLLARAGCESIRSLDTSEEPGDPQPFASTQTRSFVSGRNDEEIQTCKKHYRDSIDEIDAEMRKGYGSEQGEVFRQRLRQLTEKLRAC